MIFDMDGVIIDSNPYHKIEKLAIHKDDCIVFEDSLSGIKSAISAGLRVVGVTTSHDKEELLEAGVTGVIDNSADLTVQEIIHL
ncbi:MAG: HAD hydrolase-like protein [Bacteroidales bacterium]|nr:HAD hydrolase-like protein [Bacteroidales bacterium]